MKSYLRQIVLFKDGLINTVYPTHFPYSVIFERQDIVSIPLSLSKAVATAEMMLCDIQRYIITNIHIQFVPCSLGMHATQPPYSEEAKQLHGKTMCKCPSLRLT